MRLFYRYVCVCSYVLKISMSENQVEELERQLIYITKGFYVFQINQQNNSLSKVSHMYFYRFSLGYGYK